MRRTTLTLLSGALVLAGLAPRPAHAQGMLDRVKKKVKDRIEQEARKAADSTPKPNAAAPNATAPNAVTPNTQAPNEPGDPPGKGVWLNYDFVPGERTIFFEDFANDNVGDFPRRMTFLDGNVEVVDIGGTHYLHNAGGRAFIAVKLPERLPERFTVEAVVHTPGQAFHFSSSNASSAGEFGCNATYAWVTSGSGAESGEAHGGGGGGPMVACRFTIDGARGVKAYLDQSRTANLPGLAFARSDTLYINVPPGSADDPVLLTALRIAEGGRPLYDLLAANGRVATHGILFATGSDRLRGESTPVLKQIGDMLVQHPDLKLTIEGHTDNVGDATSNQTLSEKRAAAVKQYLVDSYHVDAARLTTKGLGASKPIAPNDTPEGRQNNRRVELVRP